MYDNVLITTGYLYARASKNVYFCLQVCVCVCVWTSAAVRERLHMFVRPSGVNTSGLGLIVSRRESCFCCCDSVASSLLANNIEAVSHSAVSLSTLTSIVPNQR